MPASAPEIIVRMAERDFADNAKALANVKPKLRPIEIAIVALSPLVLSQVGMAIQHAGWLDRNTTNMLIVGLLVVVPLSVFIIYVNRRLNALTFLALRQEQSRAMR